MFCFNITFEINIHSVISEDNACSLLISLKYEPSSSRENLTSGFSTRVDSNQPAQPQKLAEWLEISDIETRDITLSNTIYAANNKGAVQIRRLICAFVVRIWHKQVFSWHGSIILCIRTPPVLLLRTKSEYHNVFGHKGLSGWLRRAMLLGSFQCRGALLLWNMVGHGPAVLATGAGQVGCFLVVFLSSCLSYLPFLMPHLLGEAGHSEIFWSQPL